MRGFRCAAPRNLIVALGLATGAVVSVVHHRVIPRRGASSHGTASGLVRQGTRRIASELDGARRRRGPCGPGHPVGRRFAGGGRINQGQEPGDGQDRLANRQDRMSEDTRARCASPPRLAGEVWARRAWSWDQGVWSAGHQSAVTQDLGSFAATGGAELPGGWRVASGRGWRQAGQEPGEATGARRTSSRPCARRCPRRSTPMRPPSPWTPAIPAARHSPCRTSATSPPTRT